MKKNQHFITSNILLLPLFMLACMTPMSEIARDESAGINGGFEHAKSGLPVNWIVYTEATTGEGKFEIALDENDYIEGKQSLRFSVESCSDKGGRFSPGISQEVEGESGVTYRVSFWLKNKSSRFKFAITSVSAFEKIGGPSMDSNNELSDWTYFEYTYSMPEKMDHLRFELNVLSAGELWIDGFEMKATNE